MGRVAQVVEQRPFKAWVAGSNPAALTNRSRQQKWLKSHPAALTVEADQNAHLTLAK